MIQKTIKESGNKILTDLITLDTPGKASVRVIILADPVSIYIVLLTIIYFINLYKFNNCVSRMDTRSALWMMKDLGNCQYQIIQVKQFWTDLFRRKHLQQIMHKHYLLFYITVFLFYFF